MTQVAVQPPVFILFVNYPNLMMESYKKYLYNQFREEFGFLGVPVTLHTKKRRQAERKRSNKEVTERVREAEMNEAMELDEDSEMYEDTDIQEGIDIEALK